MAGSVPPAPEFGETLPVETSPETVAFLARRRSASAMTLTAPGPDKEPNWLPAPEGAFQMFLRLYWPKAEALDGSWQPPKAVKVG